MLNPNLNTSQLEQLVSRILASYKMTTAEQRFLMHTLLSKENITQADRALIDRVYQGLRKGLVRIAD